MYRIRPGGRWQRLLPGVVLMHTGTPTARERHLGCLAYAGARAVVTGTTALRSYGLRSVARLQCDQIHLLVPHDCRRQSHPGLIVERTRRLPEGSDLHLVRGIPVTPLARALVDACRRLPSVEDIREVVCDAVQNHRLDLAALRRELDACARQRTAGARMVVREIEAGVRFAAEARARELIRSRHLPEPIYNPEIHTSDGRFIARPDGYYPQWACGYDIDSRRWHLSARAYEATVRRRGFIGRFGIVMLAVTPERIFEDPDGFIEDLRGVLDTARSRPAPTGLRVTPLAA